MASQSSKGNDAVAKAKTISASFLKLKKPGVDISQTNIKLSTPLEIKYNTFMRNDDTVTKIGILSNSEVTPFVIFLLINCNYY